MLYKRSHLWLLCKTQKHGKYRYVLGFYVDIIFIVISQQIGTALVPWRHEEVLIKIKAYKTMWDSHSSSNPQTASLHLWMLAVIYDKLYGQEKWRQALYLAPVNWARGMNRNFTNIAPTSNNKRTLQMKYKTEIIKLYFKNAHI